jgi:hypothetical protein
VSSSKHLRHPHRARVRTHLNPRCCLNCRTIRLFPRSRFRRYHSFLHVRRRSSHRHRRDANPDLVPPASTLSIRSTEVIVRPMLLSQRARRMLSRRTQLRNLCIPPNDQRALRSIESNLSLSPGTKSLLFRVVTKNRCGGERAPEWMRAEIWPWHHDLVGGERAAQRHCGRVTLMCGSGNRARCATRRRRSVTFAHGRESVSAQCLRERGRVP